MARVRQGPQRLPLGPLCVHHLHDPHLLLREKKPAFPGYIIRHPLPPNFIFQILIESS